MTHGPITGIPGAVGPDDRRRFRMVQALQDAIVFRRARAGTYCFECDRAPGGHCADHACDLDLIAGYEQDARAISAAMSQEAISGQAPPLHQPI